jgi:hypothetical protein
MEFFIVNDGAVAARNPHSWVVSYFEVPNKFTHIRNAINTVPDTMTRNAKVPIAMPIQ